MHTTPPQETNAQVVGEQDVGYISHQRTAPSEEERWSSTRGRHDVSRLSTATPAVSLSEGRPWSHPRTCRATTREPNNWSQYEHGPSKILRQLTWLIGRFTRHITP